MNTTNEPKPIVLLIDDSPDVCRIVRARLQHEHLELLSEATAAKGLEAARRRRPAVILLDLDMPDCDGFAALRSLKADPETATIPVVILSGVGTPEDKVTAFDLGATDFCSKSFNSAGDVAELRARIRAVLRLDRLLRLLAERAEVDGLTGLGNRTQFTRRLTQEFAQNQRYSHPLSLAMIDADHFKRVNDTFGHPAGDEVLAGAARIIHQSIRGTDIACRYGGEEFAIIFPHTPPADAATVCDRIRSAIGQIVWPRHPEHSVTVSVGVAGADGHAIGTVQSLIEAADRSLYEAKRLGRNRTVTAQPADPLAKSA